MQITLQLPAETGMQLRKLAFAERRRPRDQAVIMLQRELARQTKRKEGVAK